MTSEEFKLALKEGRLRVHNDITNEWDCVVVSEDALGPKYLITPTERKDDE